MPLTTAQLDALVTANPYFARSYYTSAFDVLKAVSVAPDIDVYTALLDSATQELRKLQYLLEVSDEVLLNMPGTLAFQVRPPAYEPQVVAHDAVNPLYVYGVIALETGGADSTIKYFHCKTGIAPSDLNLISMVKILVATDRRHVAHFNLVLLPGEKLQAQSTSGACSFSSYTA